MVTSPFCLFSINQCKYGEDIPRDYLTTCKCGFFRSPFNTRMTSRFWIFICRVIAACLRARVIAAAFSRALLNSASPGMTVGSCRVLSCMLESSAIFFSRNIPVALCNPSTSRAINNRNQVTFYSSSQVKQGAALLPSRLH